MVKKLLIALLLNFSADNTLTEFLPQDTVWAGSYRPVITGQANRGADNFPQKDMFFFGHNLRIRQNGTITKVQLYCASTSGLNGVYIKIWRRTGNTFTLIGVSNNIVNELDSGQTKLINLTSPITGVNEGDYYSILIQNGCFNFFAVNQPYTRAYCTYSNPTGSYCWFDAPVRDSGYCIPVRFYMCAPKIVFIGNSIISGYYQHKSFIEPDTALNNIHSSIPFRVSDSLGWTYQNMAYGGHYTSTLKNRFKTDVTDLKPEYVLIEGGINDIINNIPSSVIVSNFSAMLDSCTSHHIKAFVVLVQPMSIVSNLNMFKRDSINCQIMNLCSIKNHYYINVGQALGVQRDTGTPPPPPGNRWNLNPFYSSGDGLGIHLNTAGNTVFSTAVLAVIRPVLLGFNHQQQGNTPKGFFLSQNYPNPFNPKTVISYQLPVSSFVKLIIYDLLGREAAVLVNKQLQPGTYKAEWDTSDFSTGVYFYTLQTENYFESKKMLMVK